MAAPAWLAPFSRQLTAPGDQDRLNQIRDLGERRIRAANAYRRFATFLCLVALAYILLFTFEALTAGTQSAAMGKSFGKWADFLAAVAALVTVFSALFSPPSSNLAKPIGKIIGKAVHPADVILLQAEIKERAGKAADRAKLIAAAVTFLLTVAKIPLG